ncbi:MAG: hypothetical protein KF709_11330 [Gemmatimonadaceae bacterium]|nr:hypothetical protein [Gemmatimonadaceae bacterium]
MSRCRAGIAAPLVALALVASPQTTNAQASPTAPAAQASPTASAAQSPPSVAPMASQARIASLGWIAGCWELRAGARVVHEHWMPPLGGAMLAVNRTVVRDTIREWEFLSITERDGKLVYTAKPSRQAETSFTSESVSDTSVAFANPAHDFPQRIIYRRVGSDSLVARIEGPRGGQMRGIDFPMRRINCQQ